MLSCRPFNCLWVCLVIRGMVIKTGVKLGLIGGRIKLRLGFPVCQRCGGQVLVNYGVPFCLQCGAEFDATTLGGSRDNIALERATRDLTEAMRLGI